MEEGVNGDDVFDDDMWREKYILRNGDERPLSVGQLSASIACSLFSCCLSIAGSTCIILAVRRKLYLVHNRLLLGLSAADIIVSVALANMSWALPEGANNIFAVGNTTTCDVVGFMFIFMMASASYSTSISLYFLFAVRYRYREQDFRCLEPVFHCVSWIPALGIAISAVSSSSINVPQLGHICTISTGPPECRQHVNEFGFKPKCYRGWKTVVPLGGTMISFLTFCALTGICSTVALFVSIRGNVMRSRRYSFRGRRLSIGTERVYRDSLHQSGLYVAAFVNSFFWLGFSTLLIEFMSYDAIRQQGAPFLFTVLILSGFFVPLQGALNAAVYFTPRVRNWQIVAPEEGLLWCFWQVVSGIEVPGGSSRSSRLSSFVSRESSVRRNRSQEGNWLGSVASYKTWNSKEEFDLGDAELQVEPRGAYHTKAQIELSEVAETSNGATFVGDEDTTLRDVPTGGAVGATSSDEDSDDQDVELRIREEQRSVVPRVGGVSEISHGDHTAVQDDLSDTDIDTAS